MTKFNMGELVNNLYQLLEPFDSEVRSKAMRAVCVLFGDAPEGVNAAPVQELSRAGNTFELPATNLQLTESAQTFFDGKQPSAKIEEIAVAARFLELTVKNHSITRSDVEDAFSAARRNFDGKNFKRDLENAKVKGLFNRSKDPRILTLSYYGQKYVDALPNRDVLKQLKSPTRAKRRKSSPKSQLQKAVKKA